MRLLEAKLNVVPQLDFAVLMCFFFFLSEDKPAIGAEKKTA